MPELRNWSLWERADQLRAGVPKSVCYYRHDRCLTGQVYGHPTHPDGQWVSTSRLVSVTGGGAAVTVSGSTYDLGEVEPAFVAFKPLRVDPLTYLRAAIGSGGDEP